MFFIETDEGKVFLAEGDSEGLTGFAMKIDEQPDRSDRSTWINISREDAERLKTYLEEYLHQPEPPQEYFDYMDRAYGID